MRRGAWSVAVVLLLTGAGCRSSGPRHGHGSTHLDARNQNVTKGDVARRSTGRGTSQGGARWWEATQPEVGLPKDEVAAKLAKHAREGDARRARAIELATAAAADGSVAAIASAVRATYALGAREVGAELMNGCAAVKPWQDAASIADVRAVFKRTGTHAGVLRLEVRRKKGVEGPIAVAFPPGTFGVAQDTMADWVDPEDDERYRDWPRPQDLGLLRAPVLFLREGKSKASVDVPVACATFEVGPPDADRPYELQAFEPGSRIDRVMVALCAGERAPDPAAQLAVWVARHDLSWAQFVKKNGHLGQCATFSSQSISVRVAAPALTELLFRAGVDPKTATFFKDAEPEVAPTPTKENPREDPVLGLP